MFLNLKHINGLETLLVMRKYFILFFILLSFSLSAQTYKYIGPEEGLSNRRVYQVQKDQKGFMWFLTRQGIDRYDGKKFKYYKLQDGFDEINPIYSQNWLFTDQAGVLYAVGKEGRIFRYDNTYDTFKLMYRMPTIINENNKTALVNYSFLNSDNTIWLCTNNYIFIWDINGKQSSIITNELNSPITSVHPVNNNIYYIGTENGVHIAELKDEKLLSLDHRNIIVEGLNIPTNTLYYDINTQKLIIGTPGHGIYIIQSLDELDANSKLMLDGVTINTIEPFKDNQYLISTDGNGIFCLDLSSNSIDQFIAADYETENGMNGNTIKDIYIDEEDRIWMANFPIGITVRELGYSTYTWLKHSIGNSQSIVNDKINAVHKDTDGDIWFATSNGISLYQVKEKKWHSFFSSYDNHNNTCKQFLSICEKSPGVIWAVGYDSDIYSIDKYKRATDIISMAGIMEMNAKPDSYIRYLYKDSKGDIWLGGHHNFKKIDVINRNVTFYNISKTICILEKDPDHLWIGTMEGLYLLDKNTKNLEHIALPIESNYIYSLHQDNQGQLYIGTSGSGLLIFNPENKQFTHYYTNNSSLISDNISSILSDDEGKYIVIGTEKGISRYYPNDKRFRNWTKDQGLRSIYFNSSSGVYYGNDYYIFGSIDGAIFFKLNNENPKYYKNKMILSDFRIFYETVYPGEKNSPLQNNIDDTKTIILNHNQNIFSMEVSSINYSYPSDVLYTWKLEGFYNKWRKLSKDNVIRYTNLNPGKYTLHIRAVSNENQQVVLEERSMQIIIKKPIWRSIWAYIIYTAILILIITVAVRYFYLRRQKVISNEKIQFFINSAHDIRTPLTLIKAPLEEIREKELLSQGGMSNMNIALRNVNSLLRLTTNLINFERTDMYSSELYISEHELNSYVTEIYQTFRSYANVKNISFTYSSNFSYLNVWFDKDKMDSIVKNVISNALKYTPDNGEVNVSLSDNNDSWSIEVADTGIGIPSSEQKKLFKMHFRGSNAVNSKVTGSGIGLILVYKLIKLHGGKVQFNSVEDKGTTIKITIPKKSSKLSKAHIASKNKNSNFVEDVENYDVPTTGYQEVKQTIDHDQRLLIVEDNDELRTYLKNTLSELYIVQTCENGKEALTIIKEYKPNLIISDIMMPVMRGDELCKIVKANIETSHIPVILLTALSDEKSVLEGITIGADEYISKPFNIGILKATITNILTNRALLQKKYVNLDIEETDSNVNLANDIDWKFIAAVKKSVEDNMDNQAFNVDILCNLLNMSRTSFYNKIKALTNQAPADYVRLIRLNKAASLLKEGKYSIVEVAEMTGFNDAKYFREVFKKHFKVSPSKYAKGETGEEKNAENKEE